MEIKLTVVEAVELRVVQHIGKQDPYVIIKYGDDKYKTKVIDDGDRNCRWDETFSFVIQNNEIIKFEVMDENTLIDSQIGVAQLNTSKLFQLNGHYEEWLDLSENVDDAVKKYGKLLLKFSSDRPMIDHTPIPNILESLQSDDIQLNKNGMNDLMKLTTVHELLELLFPTNFIQNLHDLIFNDKLLDLITTFFWKLSTVIHQNEQLKFPDLFPCYKLLFRNQSVEIFTNSLKSFSNFIIYEQFHNDPQLIVLLDELMSLLSVRRSQKEQESILKVFLQYSCKDIPYFANPSKHQEILTVLDEGTPECVDVCFAIFTNIITDNSICEKCCDKLIQILFRRWENRNSSYILNSTKCFFNLIFNIRSHQYLSSESCIRQILSLINVSHDIKSFIIAILYKLSSFEPFLRLLCTDDVLREMKNCVNLNNNSKFMIVGLFRNLSCRAYNKDILKRNTVDTIVKRLEINNKDSEEFIAMHRDILANLK